MQLFYKPQINGLNGSKPLFFLHSPTYTTFCFVAFNGAGSLTVKSCKKRKEKNQDKRCKSSQCVGRYCKVCILWMKSVRPFKNYQDDTARFYTFNEVNLRIKLDTILKMIIFIPPKYIRLLFTFYDYWSHWCFQVANFQQIFFNNNSTHHCTKRISIEQVINVPNVICTYYHHEQLYNTSFTTLLKRNI